LNAYLLNSIAKAELQKDSLINSIIEKLGVDNIADVNSQTRVSWVVETKIGPLIPIKWGQHMPFNGSLGQACPPYQYTASGYTNTNDGRYPTGCVATALIQIQSYWEHPIIHPFTGVSWAIFKKYKQFHNFNDSAYLPQAERELRAQSRFIVGNLFRQIGGIVNMGYGCNGSGANSQDAIDFLGKNGYTVSALVNFNSSMVLTSVSNGRPVWARGCTSNGLCHAWVIDGSLTRTTMVNGAATLTEYYVYNNWGWDGMDDDIFPIGVFNPGAYNFQNDIKIATVYR
jgi:hypothetical protein